MRLVRIRRCCTGSKEFFEIKASAWLASGFAHGAHFAAAGTAAVEDTGAAGLHSGHGDASGQFEALEDFARFRIDAADFALVGFQGGVPEFAVDPGNARDEPIRFDRAQDGAGLGFNLVNLAGAILSHPERPLGPSQARIAAVGWRRDGGDNLARAGVNFLNPVAGQLPQVPAIEGRARFRRDAEFADHRAALGIERDDALAAGEPDLRAVEGYAPDLVHAGKGAVFADDLRPPGCALALGFVFAFVRRCHDATLAHRQCARE